MIMMADIDVQKRVLREISTILSKSAKSLQNPSKPYRTLFPGSCWSIRPLPGVTPCGQFDTIYQNYVQTPLQAILAHSMLLAN